MRYSILQVGFAIVANRFLAFLKLLKTKAHSEIIFMRFVCFTHSRLYRFLFLFRKPIAQSSS